ncbi:MAG: hypothetical protein H3C27_01105 [Opitutaceae bacterium]|nr:hypothetical protein [Opitutaceae bacterium]
MKKTPAKILPGPTHPAAWTMRFKDTCSLSWALRDYRRRAKRAGQQALPEVIEALSRVADGGRVTRGARYVACHHTAWNTAVQQSWREQPTAPAGPTSA